MSMLRSWGAYAAIILVIALSVCCWAQHNRINGLTSELELSNGIVRQLQQSQQLADGTSQKFQERKEELQHEQERQAKVASEALDAHQDWADAYLPESVLRLFREGAAADTGAVPATDGASR